MLSAVLLLAPALVAGAVTFAPRAVRAQGAAAPFAVEYYYKIRW